VAELRSAVASVSQRAAPPLLVRGGFFGGRGVARFRYSRLRRKGLAWPGRRQHRWCRLNVHGGLQYASPTRQALGDRDGRYGRRDASRITSRVTASRSRPYARVLVLMELSLEANTGATLAPMKPKATLATALLMVALVVAILVAWIIWRRSDGGIGSLSSRRL
jgi:hypothetical protein